MQKQVLVQRGEFRKADYQKFRVVADVGATNTYIAIMGVRDFKRYDLIFKHVYLTQEIRKVHEALNQALKEAKEEYDIETGVACVGAAGPVSRQRGHIRLTNADLEICTKEIISGSLLQKVILVNDFEAVGYGIDLLDMDKDVVRIPHAGQDLSDGGRGNTVAVIGASKGLGMSMAPYDLKKCLHLPIPSEGGHIDFAPYNKEEFELAEYLKASVLEKKNVQPEMERLVSVDGIQLIYDFLQRNRLAELSGMSGLEKIRMIEKGYGSDPACTKAIDMFISFYARAARSLALMSECYSGLFLTGKIALVHQDRLRARQFMEIFEQHDKRSDVLRKIPVYLVRNPDIGLYGCCNVTVNFFNI